MKIILFRDVQNDLQIEVWDRLNQIRYKMEATIEDFRKDRTFPITIDGNYFEIDCMDDGGDTLKVHLVPQRALSRDLEHFASDLIEYDEIEDGVKNA